MREKGSVTVFLSFTFLIIMSLVFALLEGARSRAAAAIADIKLTTCVESLLGEYYRPLFEKYNVFGIDTSFGGKTPNIGELTEVMTGFSGESSFGLSLEKGEITATRPFLTKDGKIFLDQVIEYEKYCAAVDSLSSLLERIGILSKENEVYKVYERQMEIENNLAVIDRNTLLMMEKIDGLVCTGSTVGEVRESFVKAFMTRGADPVSVGINNPELWMLLEGKYFDPAVYVGNAEEKLAMAVPEAEKRDLIQANIKNLVSERESKNLELSRKTAELGKMLEEQEPGKNKQEKTMQRERENALREEIKRLSGEISELDEAIGELSEERNKLDESINDLVLTASIQTDELMRKASGCLREAKDAVALIEEDRKITEKTRPLIESFESILEKSRAILSEETYSSFQTSLTKMRRYTGMDGQEPDHVKMEESLKTDVRVLGNVLREANISAEVANATMTGVSVDMIGGWSRRLDSVKAGIREYSYENLVFDYSQIRPDRLLCELSDGLKRTVAKGFLGLLIDEEKISDRKLDVRTRPSDLSEQNDREKTYVREVLSEELGKESGAESFIRADAGRDLSEITGLIDENATGFMDKLMLILYIREHFGDNIDKVRSSQSALAYEQEYILFGNNSDAENLAEMASKIMLVRMVTSGAYVLTNASLRMRATEIAASMVGFTGLHFLTTIVKYVILFAWSAEQAIVETAAIIAGKKVPVITTSSSYCIDSFDLSAVTALGIKEKVGNFKESEVSLLYGDYLFMFMIMSSCEELCLRSMDMIEENMRWAYDENFLLQNCITGFDTKLEFSCPSRYVNIFDGLYADIETPSGYGFVRTDSVDY